MNFPQDTRNNSKSTPRDSIHFPQTLPSVHPVQQSIHNVPVYDRNLFNNDTHFNEVRRGTEIGDYIFKDKTTKSIESDRLFQTTQIYQNFQEHDHFLRPINPYYKQLNSQNNQKFEQTRERRDERISFQEQRNMDRFFMSQRDYNQEVNERVNGFSMMAKDTRYDGTKKMENNNMEMRSTRYVGMPGKNL